MGSTSNADTLTVDDIRTERTRDGVRFVFPYRRFAAQQGAGIVKLIGSLIMAGFAYLWFSSVLGMVATNPGGATPSTGSMIFVLAFAAIGLIPGIGALSWFCAGVAMIASRWRSEILITDRHVVFYERTGLVRKRSKRRIDRLQTIRLESLEADGSERSNLFPVSLGGICVQTNRRVPMSVGRGYPIDMLREFAPILGQEISARRGDDALLSQFDPDRRMRDNANKDDDASIAEDAHVGGIPIVDSLDAEEDESPVDASNDVPRPATTTISLERNGDELNIHVPPAGIWRGSKGLFFFATLWNGFLSAFTVGLLRSTKGVGNYVFGGVFIAVFWIIGIGILIAAINMGRRKAFVDVVGDTVLISRKNLFGVKQRELAREDIAAILMGPSGMSVNDQPVMHLQIHLQNDEKFGMLTSRSEDELRWLAAELRTHLDKPARVN